MPQPILSANELTVRYGAQAVLENVDITICDGDRIGLVGRNGAGKSTLLQILAGTLAADSGKVTTVKGLERGFLPQEFALDETATVIDNIRAGAPRILDLIGRYEAGAAGSSEGARLEAEIQAAGGWDLDVRVQALMQALQTPAGERSVHTLSGGEKRRVALCRALIGRPPLLLLDEPTNHLDLPAIQWLENFLAAFGETLVLVTHDRSYLERICNRIIELGHGAAHSHNGNYTHFLELKSRRQEAAELKEYRRLSFLRRELAWVQRGPQARTTKAKARLDRYHTAVAQQGPAVDQEMELVIPPASKLGNRVVELNQVRLEQGGRCLCEQLTFAFAAGNRIGVIGRNGTGKTTLLRSILGELPPAGGTITTGSLTAFNYISQERSQLNDDDDVFAAVGDGLEFVRLGDQTITLWGYLKRFLFEDERIRTVVGELSGGERARVLLAKQLKKGGNFLVLDEPTNDLDLPTLRVLEEGLVRFSGCVLVVSHDRYFLNRVCTGILAFEGDSRVVYHEGDFDCYMAKRGLATVATAPGREKKAKPPKSRQRRLSWKEARELESMEATILDAESELQRLESLFSSPDFYEHHGHESTDLAAQLEELRVRIPILYDRWQELENIAGSKADAK